MIQIVNYSIYFGSFFLNLCHLMLCILHQIYIFYNSRLDSSSQNLHISNCIIKTKLLKHISIKPDCHWPAQLWLLSYSQYPDYLMRKLTFFIKEKSQLHLTGFSSSPLTMVFKSNKSHASISGQSADKLDNLSCICISE